MRKYTLNVIVISVNRPLLDSSPRFLFKEAVLLCDIVQTMFYDYFCHAFDVTNVTDILLKLSYLFGCKVCAFSPILNVRLQMYKSSKNSPKNLDPSY